MAPPASFTQCSFRSISRDQFHEIAYTRWGEAGTRGTVVCVHGLTRQGRDFDFIAGRLAADGYVVICPDVVGRGLSGRLLDPADYDLPQYELDMAFLIASLRLPPVDWIGSSLGGQIGILLAGRANSPIRRLVVNDIGPDLPLNAVLRIGTYVENAPASFASREAAEMYFRGILAPFGNLTQAQWRHLSDYSIKPLDGGGFTLRYDRGIPRGFTAPVTHRQRMWKAWERIECPILILRGAESDLLLPKTAEEMVRRNPRAKLVEVPDCGHAPPLLAESQTRIVEDWLQSQENEGRGGGKRSSKPTSPGNGRPRLPAAARNQYAS
jgi:pimeloyl-ACP methyl ester carboxylesterase